MNFINELAEQLTILRVDNTEVCYINAPVKDLSNLAKGILKSNGLSGDIQEADRFHITLAIFPNFPDSAINEFLQLRLPIKFNTTATKLGTFPLAPSKPLILHIDPDPALVRLQSDIYNLGIRLGLQLPDFDVFKASLWQPHITLAMDVENMPEEFKQIKPVKVGVDRFVFQREGYDQIIEINLPGSIEDRPFVTVRSVERHGDHIGQQGRKGAKGGSEPGFTHGENGTSDDSVLDEVKKSENANRFVDAFAKTFNPVTAFKLTKLASRVSFWLSPDGNFYAIFGREHAEAAQSAYETLLREGNVPQVIRDAHERLRTKGTSLLEKDASFDLAMMAGFVRGRWTQGTYGNKDEIVFSFSEVKPNSKQRTAIEDLFSILPERTTRMSWGRWNTLDLSSLGAGDDRRSLRAEMDIVKRISPRILEVSEEEFITLLSGGIVMVGPMRRMITLDDGPFAVRHGKHVGQEGRKGDKGGTEPGFTHEEGSVGGEGADEGKKNGKPADGEELSDVDPEVLDLAEELISNAEEREPAITEMLENIAEQNQAEFAGLEHRIKKLKTLMDKISRDVEEQMIDPERAALEISDVVRYTFLFEPDEYVSKVAQVQDDLEENGWNQYDSKWKNYFRKGDAYDGYNTVMVDSEGNRFELQFHTPESIGIKARSHKIYEQFQESPPSDPRRSRLWNQMVELWTDYEKPENWETLEGVLK